MFHVCFPQYRTFRFAVICTKNRTICPFPISAVITRVLGAGIRAAGRADRRLGVREAGVSVHVPPAEALSPGLIVRPSKRRIDPRPRRSGRGPAFPGATPPSPAHPSSPLASLRTPKAATATTLPAASASPSEGAVTACRLPCPPPQPAPDRSQRVCPHGSPGLPCTQGPPGSQGPRSLRMCPHPASTPPPRPPARPAAPPGPPSARCPSPGVRLLSSRHCPQRASLRPPSLPPGARLAWLPGLQGARASSGCSSARSRLFPPSPCS